VANRIGKSYMAEKRLREALTLPPEFDRLVRRLASLASREARRRPPASAQERKRRLPCDDILGAGLFTAGTPLGVATHATSRSTIAALMQLDGVEFRSVRFFMVSSIDGVSFLTLS